MHAETADTKPFDPAITKTWLPVNAYIGGAEHAVLHLLYARFVTMALKDWGWIEFEEPFPFLFGHGLIIKDGSKMSKSKGNVVNPDEYIEKFGADTLRTYLMFLGPYDQGGDFRDSGIAGMYRWLQKIWVLAHEKLAKTTTLKLEKKLHKTIKKCTEDMAQFKYNTSIAMLMECANVWSEEGESMSQKDMLKFIQLLAPFAPFLTEEIFQENLEQHASMKSKTSKTFGSIHTSSWPSYDPTVLVEENIEIVVQINGKFRDRITVLIEEAANREALIEAARRCEKVVSAVEKREITKVIAVPGKLVNFVIE